MYPCRRIDLIRHSGAFGQELYEKLVKHIEKMAEPPPSKITKALPIPQETNRKKRGGRR
jgi:U4/U6 small nuclear ribonucleoprotein PRP31